MGEIEEKTWVILNTENHEIDVDTLSKILHDVQKAYENIGQSRYGDDYNKDDVKLYIKEIVPGSVALPVYHSKSTSSPATTIDSFRDVATCFEAIIEASGTDQSVFQSVLEKEVIDPSNRLGVLKSMQSLSQLGADITIKLGDKKPQRGPTLGKKNKSLIAHLISTYEIPAEMEIRGIMLGFHAEKDPYYFTLKTESGRSVRCNFEKGRADEFHAMFWKWVSVTGNGVTKQKTYSLSSVVEMKEYTTKTLNRIGDYSFKKPVTFRTSYQKEDNMWCMICEDLAIYGYGENYHQLLISIEEEIENLAVCFTQYADSEMTPESADIRKKLAEYMDLKTIYTIFSRKCGETK